jgi:hypothetical protein
MASYPRRPLQEPQISSHENWPVHSQLMNIALITMKGLIKVEGVITNEYKSPKKHRKKVHKKYLHIEQAHMTCPPLVLFMSPLSSIPRSTHDGSNSNMQTLKGVQHLGEIQSSCDGVLFVLVRCSPVDSYQHLR